MGRRGKRSTEAAHEGNIKAGLEGYTEAEGAERGGRRRRGKGPKEVGKGYEKRNGDVSGDEGGGGGERKFRGGGKIYRSGYTESQGRTGELTEESQGEEEFDARRQEGSDQGVRTNGGDGNGGKRGGKYGYEEYERKLKRREPMKPKMVRGAGGIGGNGRRREGGQEEDALGGENMKKKYRKSNVPIKRRISDEQGGQIDKGNSGDEKYIIKRRHSEKWINEEIRNGSRIPVRSKSGSWEPVNPSTSSSGTGGWEGERYVVSDGERRRSNGDAYRRYSNGQTAGRSGRDRSKGRANNKNLVNGDLRLMRRGSYDPTSERNKYRKQKLMRSRSMGRNSKRRYEDSTERWSRDGINNKNNKNNYKRLGNSGRLRGGRSEDDARRFSDRRRSYLEFSRGRRGRDLLVSGRGDTSLGTGPYDAGETDYDAVLLLSYQQALKSTRYGSPRQLTRSLSEGSVYRRIATLEKRRQYGLIKRSKSADRLLYAPHKWYYDRIARREAKQKARQAEEEARLAAEEAGESPPELPNMEILSLDASLSGPIASLKEGVISGMEIQNTNGALLASRPDRLQFTYEVEVDGEALGRKVGKRGAWASDTEGEGEGVARQAASQNKSPDNLSNRLDNVLKEKAKAEDLRQKLFSQARELHEKIQRKREKRRQEWWTAWTDARREGTQLEERQASLRRELDAMHRRIIGSIIKRQPLVTGVRDEPSRRANYKISIIRLRHEIEDLKRRVEAMHIKVEAEKKLRSHAEQEVKTLRSEVSRKKANMALTQARSNSLRHLPLLPHDLVVRM
ncbi:uncharacterized protein LOC127001464 isoform X1 [Eriocheir sinensis]|uniref:uncharacterized protein LOC127001464 isoform X1 n=1 Tax=Eriocheir sinensis TaxID=95602 RepID=UPI0021C8F32F|nr:uncharacterized protein LOC127001464 isoform X1 [Eriocheir sinensis]